MNQELISINNAKQEETKRQCEYFDRMPINNTIMWQNNIGAVCYDIVIIWWNWTIDNNQYNAIKLPKTIWNLKKYDKNEKYIIQYDINSIYSQNDIKI